MFQMEAIAYDIVYLYLQLSSPPPQFEVPRGYHSITLRGRNLRGDLLFYPLLLWPNYSWGRDWTGSHIHLKIYTSARGSSTFGGILAKEEGRFAKSGRKQVQYGGKLIWHLWTTGHDPEYQKSCFTTILICNCIATQSLKESCLVVGGLTPLIQEASKFTNLAGANFQRGVYPWNCHLRGAFHMPDPWRPKCKL